jgi:hypothetical protein
VVVQRHRVNVEGFAQLAHAHRADAVQVGEGDRGLQHAPTAQGDPSLAFGCGSLHLVVLTLAIAELTT